MDENTKKIVIAEVKHLLDNPTVTIDIEKKDVEPIYRTSPGLIPKNIGDSPLFRHRLVEGVGRRTPTGVKWSGILLKIETFTEERRYLKNP